MALACAGLLVGPLAARAGSPHFPIDPAEAERRLRFEPFEIVEAKRTAAGVAGARRVKLRFEKDGLELWVKWKAAPQDRGDGWNNSPRREVAAYEVQKLFLDPDDYLVPPSVTRCISLETYKPILANAQPTLPKTECVFGVLSLWLEDVTQPDDIYDLELFQKNPSYRFHLGNLNILGILIDHQDGRAANFLRTDEDDDDDRIQVFSIDNGIAFGVLIHNFLVPNWNTVRLPGLPRSSIERVRALRDEDFASLGVLAELRVDPAGVLRHVEPGENISTAAGMRRGEGVVQIGLKGAEISAMKRRRDHLLEEVASGRVSLF